MQELARIVEHRHEVAACAQKAVNEQNEREHRRDQRLLLAVEKSHAADVEKCKVERRHGVHRRAALQDSYARRQNRAREVLGVGDEALLEACETRAPRHRANVRDARIVHRAHRLPRLLETLREGTHGTPAEFLFCDRALQDGASLRFARNRRLLHAREELAADRIKLLHRRCRRCADVQMRAVEAARRRLIDRIDRVTRIEKAAGNGGRLSVARQRTIHQRRTEETPDEAVVRRLSRRVKLRKAHDGHGKSLRTPGEPLGFQTREKRPRFALRQQLVLLRRRRMRRKHLVTREQEHAPYLRQGGRAQHGVEAAHPQHGIALQTIDEEIEILHGKDHARLSALQGAVIRLHTCGRVLLLARRKARDVPRLLAKTRGKQLLQEARQPRKHHFFRPCTHILVSGSIRLTFAHHPT